jgi:hypothetical protein
LWETEEYREQNWPELAKGSGGQKINDNLFEVVIDESAIFDTYDNTREGFQKNLKSEWLELERPYPKLPLPHRYHCP